MQKLASTDKGFAQAFARLLAPRADAAAAEHSAQVAKILHSIKTGGDAALRALARQLDGLGDHPFAVSADEYVQAEDKIPPVTLEALTKAAARVRAFHERTRPQDVMYRDEFGNMLQHRWGAVDSVGLYVPGGRASYPSSVLMNAIPAQLAGVKRLVMVTPCGATPNPLVLAAASQCGVDEVYRVGGAHAIAALAFGTQSIAPVDMIVGPGNAYVTEAKRQLFGRVGIDMIAGPSEVLIIADAGESAELIAADLLAQAEHDPLARALLLTTSTKLAGAVEKAIPPALEALPTRDVAAQAWRDWGTIITAATLDEIVGLANMLAAEHVQLMGKKAEALAPRLRHAGAIFLGSHTPEAIGDYIAGPNHVLPTQRSARYASGLSVASFMKRSNVLRCTPQGYAALAPHAVELAEAESLLAHARSLRLRMRGKN